MPQVRTQVVIFGRTYQLRGADPEHTRQIARTVDETMQRFSAGLPGAESYQLAILAALHLADELATVREDYDSYRAKVDRLASSVLDSIEGGLDEEQDHAGPRTQTDKLPAAAALPIDASPEAVAGSPSPGTE